MPKPVADRLTIHLQGNNRSFAALSVVVANLSDDGKHDDTVAVFPYVDDSLSTRASLNARVPFILKLRDIDDRV